MPDSYRVILQPEAFENLDAIFAYIKTNSPQNAIRMVDRLWEACQSLSLFPHRYKIYQRFQQSEKSVHSMPVPPFLVFYNVNEQPHVVRILTIRHGARKPLEFQ